MKFNVADDAVVEKFLLAVVVQLGSSEACIGSLLRSQSGIQGSLIGNLVDDKERLTLRNLLTFRNAQPLQGAGHLRIDLDVLPTANGSAVVRGHGHLLRLDGHRLKVGAWHLLLSLVAAARRQKSHSYQ